jgi:O-antigen/teichoic acid export membrane protein
MTKTVTTSRRLIHNTLFNVLAFMSNAIVGFFLIPFFLGQLGPARWGVWVLIGSVFRYMGILSMGLNSAINRRIPMYLAHEDKRGVQNVISTALLFFSALGGVLLLLTLLFSVKIGDWFAIEPELVRSASLLVLIVGLCYAVSSPLQLSSAALSGLQRYDIISILMLVALVVRTVLLVVLLLHGYGLLTMGLAFGISEIVVRVLQFSFVRRLLPDLSISFKNVDLALLKEMLHYGLNTFLYTTGALIIYKASDLVIGIFLGTTAVGYFAIAMAGVFLLSHFLQAFTAAIKPAVSDLDARDDQARMKQIAFLTQKYSLLCIIPAVAFLVIMGRQFLTVWVGAKVQDPAVLDSLTTVLTILAVAHGLMLTQHSNFLVLVGRGQHRVFGILTAVEAVLCVCGAVFTVKVLGWGLVGIAWCNLVPIALVAGGILPIYFNRKMKIPARDSLTRVWWPALLGSLPAVALLLLWKYVAPPDSWPTLFAVVAAAAGVTLACSWFLSLAPAERRSLLAVLDRKGAAPASPGAEIPPMG